MVPVRFRVSGLPPDSLSTSRVPQIDLRMILAITQYTFRILLGAVSSFTWPSNNPEPQTSERDLALGIISPNASGTLHDPI